MQWNIVFLLIPYLFVFSLSISFRADSSQVTGRGRVCQSPRRWQGQRPLIAPGLTAAEGGPSASSSSSVPQHLYVAVQLDFLFVC